MNVDVDVVHVNNNKLHYFTFIEVSPHYEKMSAVFNKNLFFPFYCLVGQLADTGHLLNKHGVREWTCYLLLALGYGTGELASKEGGRKIGTRARGANLLSYGPAYVAV